MSVRADDTPVAARRVRAVLEATRDPGQRIVPVTTSIAIDEPVATIELAGRPERKLNNLIRSFATLPLAVTPA